MSDCSGGNGKVSRLMFKYYHIKYVERSGIREWFLNARECPVARLVCLHGRSYLSINCFQSLSRSVPSMGKK